MRRFILAAAIIVIAALTTPTVASASCHTHRCWQKVRVNRLEGMVAKRIAAITPYRCGPERSVVPCDIVNHESAMCGYWLALNGCGQASSRVPCAERACGLYQLLGREKHAPWPVIVTWGKRPWRGYETLKRELRHHRIARRLWGQQRAGLACHWCY